jgi:hypothetical protein
VAEIIEGHHAKEDMFEEDCTEAARGEATSNQGKAPFEVQKGTGYFSSGEASGLRQNQRPTYKYDESDRGPYKVLVRPASCVPRSSLSGVDIGRLLERLDIEYQRISQES